jgi:hypothetical protein
MSRNVIFIIKAKSLGEYLIISKVKLIRNKENLVTNLTFNHYLFGYNITEVWMGWNSKILVVFRKRPLDYVKE